MAPRKVPNKRAIPAESSDKPTPTKRQKVKREGKDSQSQDQPYDLTSEAGDPKSKSVNHHAPARQRAPRKQAAIQTPCLKKELATWEGNKFPHYMSGNVYIIIHPTNKKYHYRLHSAVLAQSSSFISSLLQVKVVEASPKDATALKKQHGGLEVLLELKRSVDNPSEWVLTREPFTIKAPTSLASTEFDEDEDDRRRPPMLGTTNRIVAPSDSSEQMQSESRSLEKSAAAQRGETMVRKVRSTERPSNKLGGTAHDPVDLDNNNVVSYSPKIIDRMTCPLGATTPEKPQEKNEATSGVNGKLQNTHTPTKLFEKKADSYALARPHVEIKLSHLLSNPGSMHGLESQVTKDRFSGLAMDDKSSSASNRAIANAPKDSVEQSRNEVIAEAMKMSDHSINAPKLAPSTDPVQSQGSCIVGAGVTSSENLCVNPHGIAETGVMMPSHVDGDSQAMVEFLGDIYHMDEYGERASDDTLDRILVDKDYLGDLPPEAEFTTISLGDAASTSQSSLYQADRASKSSPTGETIPAANANMDALREVVGQDVSSSPVIERMHGGLDGNQDDDDSNSFEEDELNAAEPVAAFKVPGSMRSIPKPSRQLVPVALLKDSAPDEEQCRAWNHILQSFCKQPVEAVLCDPETAYKDCVLFSKLAAQMGYSETDTILSIRDILIDQLEDLPAAIVQNPPKWLVLAIQCKHETIYTEAVVHIVGHLPDWPWLISKGVLPDRVWTMLHRKVRELEAARTRVRELLFTTSICLYDKPVELTETTYGSWMVVNLWRQWFVGNYTTDHKKLRGLYNKIFEAGESYLPFLEVYKTLQTFFDLTPAESAEIAADLTLMKSQAKEFVRELCTNRSLLCIDDVEIGHLTCTKVYNNDICWRPSFNRVHSRAAMRIQNPMVM